MPQTRNQNKSPQDTIVLVTGGSGFIASFTLVQLLEAGYQVRTTVRKLSKADAIRESIKEGGQDPSKVEFFEANLLEDNGWPEATKNADYVLHMASPFPPGAPKHEDDLIRPAKEGTLRVLRAATEAKVKRVVVTSSVAAIAAGGPPLARAYDENDWTFTETAPAYPKSKTLAEKAAWEFVKNTPNAPELTTVNPPAVYGPLLSNSYGTSVGFIQKLLVGDPPFLINTSYGAVDVRDVADLHIRAMTHPKAAGERFLAASEGPAYSFVDIAEILRDNLSAEEASRIPTIRVPDTVVRLIGSYFNSLRPWVATVGVSRKFYVQKGRELLGWKPRPVQESIVDTARSLIDRKLV